MQNTIDNTIETPVEGQSLSDNSIHSKKPQIRSITLSKNRKMAKEQPHSRSSRNLADDPQTNVVKLGNRNYKKVEMIPRNTAQETYIEALFDKRMVFAVGPAGTGKTLLGVLRAIKALDVNIERTIVRVFTTDFNAMLGKFSIPVDVNRS